MKKSLEKRILYSYVKSNFRRFSTEKFPLTFDRISLLNQFKMGNFVDELIIMCFSWERYFLCLWFWREKKIKDISFCDDYSAVSEFSFTTIKCATFFFWSSGSKKFIFFKWASFFASLDFELTKKHKNNNESGESTNVQIIWPRHSSSSSSQSHESRWISFFLTFLNERFVTMLLYCLDQILAVS